MKRRIWTAAAVLLFLIFLSLMGAYNLNCILSGHIRECSWNPMTAFSGLTDQRVRLFFFLLVSFSALLVGYMLFANSYIKYKSDMQQITPDIQTSKAEGQGQYGTARWMSKEQIESVFSVVVIDAQSQRIRQLIEEGNDEVS